MRNGHLLLACALGFLLLGNTLGNAHAAAPHVDARTSPAAREGSASVSKSWESEVPRLLEKFKASDDLPSLNEALRLLEAAEPAQDEGAKDAASKSAAESASASFKAKLLRLLQTFNALDAKIIPRFDLASPPSISIAPPAEYGGLVGVAPEAIHDPKERALYEKNLAANQAKLKQYSLQVALHEADQRCTELFVDHLAHRPRLPSKKAVNQLIEATIRSKKRAAALAALW